MTVGRLLGFVIAAAMLAGGLAMAAAGIGWLGGGRSETWSIVGALLAGFGIALGISIVQQARQRSQLSELERSRYGGRKN